MSFNPVTEWVPPQTQTIRKESIVEFAEIPKSKRLLQIILAVIYCLFSAGVVFGYAAIKPVLIEEGAYKNLCTAEELEKGISPCYAQEIRLNLMFTAAAVATNVCALPVGTVLDRYGPRVSGIIGSILIAIGALFFSFAMKAPFDAWLPGYIFLALGGPFTYISSFQLSNCFPQHSGLILALLTGAFDSSSALFLIFRLIYEKTSGQFDTQKLFLVYLVVPIYIFVVQVFVMPRDSYKTVGEIIKEADEEINAPTPDDSSDLPESERERLHEQQRYRRQSIMSEVDTLLESPANKKRVQREESKNKKSGVWGVLHGYSALEQIRTPWFWLITFFTVIQMTRINYFVATIRPQETYLLGSASKAKMVNDFFDAALPLGGVLSIPFIGIILDHLSTPSALGLLVVIASIIGALGCLPFTWAAITNICLFVVYRPFYYTAVSDYAAKVFGFQTFGKVYGLIICLAGLFNFVQSPLDAMTHKVFHNNPIPVNLILLFVAFIIGGSLVLFVWRKSYTMEREMLEDEAEGAREILMPGATRDDGVNGNGSRGYGTTD
ncbi:putative major facilitator superfamily transporter [Phaeomoniella chlamydospora]|uniref:Putative major facilitator superfamily transporter n=1 Tax=Phaeomoniella chlamydospora TaxID=158046 RepID=A0A0G2GMF3_PHACM|nr:putative major facilitator superfamily transporter [Phaeomoniella chlamydospora]